MMDAWPTIDLIGDVIPKHHCFRRLKGFTLQIQVNLSLYGRVEGKPVGHMFCIFPFSNKV